MPSMEQAFNKYFLKEWMNAKAITIHLTTTLRMSQLYSHKLV
jgi:hypothetical protein